MQQPTFKQIGTIVAKLSLLHRHFARHFITFQSSFFDQISAVLEKQTTRKQVPQSEKRHLKNSRLESVNMSQERGKSKVFNCMCAEDLVCDSPLSPLFRA